ncbi:Bug family tripartite tricarboxylate transporter substrate binding protein [Falsiroseomonas sp. HW251]|uniref:Bug family tripartite tricarboxylate transporter substrate binding protein n=1 Tax=Falsiroseomonas sp. HW251 TaxID=3390998 RepID=UPI003D310170
MPDVSRRTLLAASGALVPVAARAQVFPDRPVRMLVGFPPGGVTDIVGRVVAEGMSRSLGQPVVVENRPGAAGNIASQAVARAAPDGYTLLLTTNASHGANPALYANPGYDAVRDFSPIALLATVTNVLVVHPSVPVRTVQELVALSRAQPGTMNFASASTGAAGHLVGEMFKSRTGADITHVPYRGAAPAQADVTAGRVQMMFGTLQTVLEPVRTGQLRALAVTSRERIPEMPDVPTLAEAVIPGFSADAWFALMGPARMPEPIVGRLYDAVRAALSDATLKERLTSQGVVIDVAGPAELGRFVEAELTKWGEAVRVSGAKAD